MRAEFKPTGLVGTMTIYSDHPKVYLRMEMPGIGVHEEGYDGQVVWERSDITGPRILEGDERALKLFGYTQDQADPAAYEKIQTLGEDQVNDEACYKLEMVPKGLKPLTVWYSKATGLSVKALARVPSQLGEIQVESYPSEYREVNGLKLAHRVVQKMLNVEQVLELQEVKLGVEIPAERFALPPSVQELLDKQKESDSPQQGN
jgi:hypothetical protein